MDKSVLIGGFGGQGVQTFGKLLTYAANEAGFNVTFYPAYGKEMRGGTSNCTVVVSDRHIGAPNRAMLDYVITMNLPSFTAFEKRVKKGGVLIINESLIKESLKRDDIKTVGIPLNDLANEMGSQMVLNIIMLGFFVKLSGILPVETARDIVEKKLGKRKNLLEMNLKAFNKGVEIAFAKI